MFDKICLFFYIPLLYGVCTLCTGLHENEGLVKGVSFNYEQHVILKYGKHDFEKNIHQYFHVIMFQNSKCTTCDEIGKYLSRFADKLQGPDNEFVQIAVVDCDTYGLSLCGYLEIEELPTLAIFKKLPYPMAKFSGDSVLGEIKDFIEYEENNFSEYSFEEEVQEKVSAKPGEVVVLSKSTIQGHISIGRHFVNFYAPWCRHCQQLSPIWKELGKSFRDNHFISISKVDCTVNIQVCRKYEVLGYPTLIYFKDGQVIEKYEGPQDHSSLKSFIASMQPHFALTRIVEVTSKTFNETIWKGATLMRFYDDACPDCQGTEDGWHDLVDDVTTGGEEIKMTKINCRKNQQKCFEQFVYSVPALVYYKDGVRVDVFRGSHHDLSELRKFVADLKNKNVVELPPPSMNYVTQLKIGSFEQVANSEKFVFIKFFVPWCEFCKSLAPAWQHLAKKMYNKKNVSIAEVNCLEQNELCRKNEIRGYPTMLLFHEGGKIDMYTGSHDVTSMFDYMIMMLKQNHYHDGL